MIKIDGIFSFVNDNKQILEEILNHRILFNSIVNYKEGHIFNIALENTSTIRVETKIASSPTSQGHVYIQKGDVISDAISYSNDSCVVMKTIIELHTAYNRHERIQKLIGEITE